jgi:hypothetical protein
LQRTLNPLARHRRSRTRRRRRGTATGTEPRAARLSADGCVPTQRRIEPVRHPGSEAGTAQVTPIFDLSPSPAPAGEVHARSVAGTRQVHHRSPGTGQAGSGSVTGHREPRHPDPVRPAALDEAARRTNPVSAARYQRKFRPGTRRSGLSARAFRRILPLSAGRAQELPVTSRAPAGRSPGRTAAPAKEASGSVNRWLRFLARAIRPRDRAHDRGRCPLYVRAQLDTVGLSWTQRDLVRLTATARETRKTQLTAYFRR